MTPQKLNTTDTSLSSSDLFAKAAQQQQTGQLRLAEQNYRMALANNPRFAEAENGLGHVLVAQGKAIEALSHFQQAIVLKPDFTSAFSNLAQTLFMLAEKNFAPEIVRKNPVNRAHIERAAKAWPTRLSAQELFSDSGLPEIAKDNFLLFFLGSSRLRDFELEQLLTGIRSAMLERTVASDSNTPPPAHLVAFYCALARQCFINEYVFSRSARELELAMALKERIDSALKDDSPIAVHLLAVFATYFPLSNLHFAEGLLKRSWPPVFQALVIQQLVEPAEEKQLREHMPRLTEIDDEISKKVRAQYEENPYPRWVITSSPMKKLTIEEYLHARFSDAEFTPLRKTTGMDLLIAGCGTGQLVAGMAQAFKKTRVLAIDLSLASLGYAKRMTDRLGLDNIEYAQADILKLPSIGRKFDVISTTGVMHHMADPLRAWRSLVSILRPGGFMHIGLYSELGRQQVSEAWRFIEERGYGKSTDDIRKCREDIMALPDYMPIKRATLSPDFYSLSDCRDLLFHAHELRLTIPQIKQFLADNQLQFIGFDMDRDDISQQYIMEFPADKTKTNLDHWYKFEKKYPFTFANMYKFWVQKRTSAPITR
jgi:2-polyprenyl-3-methyl-5-hydroxy-6-metoxy-1,4-benzoquinol methylase